MDYTPEEIDSIRQQFEAEVEALQALQQAELEQAQADYLRTEISPEGRYRDLMRALTGALQDMECNVLHCFAASDVGKDPSAKTYLNAALLMMREAKKALMVYEGGPYSYPQRCTEEF